MAKLVNSKRRTVPHRRKREGRTDYKKRILLLLSEKPRLVVRKTNHQVIVQLVAYFAEGDKILCTATPKDLKNAGWTFSFKNTPACYLLGLALGKKALKQQLNEAVVDLGLQKSIHGGKLYAVVKGCIDAGMQVPCSTEVFPSEDRLFGKKIEAYVPSAKGIVKKVEEAKAKLLH